jgi:hypothetical protein
MAGVNGVLRSKRKGGWIQHLEESIYEMFNVASLGIWDKTIGVFDYSLFQAGNKQSLWLITKHAGID